MTNTEVLAWWEENKGKRGRDKITDYKGTIVGCAFHLTGCATIGLVGKVSGDEQKFNTTYFDISRIDVVHGSEPANLPESSTKGAGDSPTSSYSL